MLRRREAALQVALAERSSEATELRKDLAHVSRARHGGGWLGGWTGGACNRGGGAGGGAGRVNRCVEGWSRFSSIKGFVCCPAWSTCALCFVVEHFTWLLGVWLLGVWLAVRCVAVRCVAVR